MIAIPLNLNMVAIEARPTSDIMARLPCTFRVSSELDLALYSTHFPDTKPH
ncbi:MAG: hypothetical protein ABJH20_01025 [Rhizobiaceae bacterium]